MTRPKNGRLNSLTMVLMLLLMLSVPKSSAEVPPRLLFLQLGSIEKVSLEASGQLNSPTVVTTGVVQRQHHSTIVGVPHEVMVGPGLVLKVEFQAEALSVGRVLVKVTSSSSQISIVEDRLTIQVIRSYALHILEILFGWVYFLAWAVAAYPQLITNYRRKSVIGLSFDFLALNVMGFLSYSLYNVGMYWVPAVQEEYHRRFPDAVKGVDLNDVLFSVNGFLCTLVSITQCIIYERGMQRVSLKTRTSMAVTLLCALIALFLTIDQKISWFDYLTSFSLIKLGVTLVKYIPQAHLNYMRKSTAGWSIGNVLLDFTGGVFSLMQMLLQAYNSGSWMILFGNFTKFGLGIISLVFDMVFIVQHYWLYRDVMKYTAVSMVEQFTDSDSKHKSNPTS
uniref:cystinosin-like n=1 Tax=Myxine glutinosa TaxID=7769 RepID=UPI00358F4618